ncbi:hypothetical protein ACOME3_005581 [Neoechinorhynchus agilis]
MKELMSVWVEGLFMSFYYRPKLLISRKKMSGCDEQISHLSIDDTLPQESTLSHAVELLHSNPPRGILKHSVSVPSKSSIPNYQKRSPTTSKTPSPSIPMDDEQRRSLRFDEMNLIATHHPADKTYGFQKVNEPPTPYNRNALDVEEDDQQQPQLIHEERLDTEALSKQLNLVGVNAEHLRRSASPIYLNSDEDEVERERRRNFEKMRAEHYNEFKVAKQLMQQGLLSDDDDEDA